jgi:hypothetical protein
MHVDTLALLTKPIYFPEVFKVVVGNTITIILLGIFLQLKTHLNYKIRLSISQTYIC